MCIFTAPVRRVANTRILVAPLLEGRQLTVYENNVEQNQKTARNAMVLPVPSGAPVTMVDLSIYRGNLWDDCESFFPQDKYELGTFGAGFGGNTWGSGEEAAPLPVQRVGGYSCTVVPTLADFGRVSRDVFELPQDIAKILEDCYGQGFSFVVCCFNGDVKAHPIAYTSARLPNGQCFIPTRHAHGGGDAAMVTDPASVVHPFVSCDSCRASPIRGSRWKCSACPDYDLCNTCYTTKRSVHRQDHPFLHLIQPEKAGFVFGQSEAAGGAADDFDHTLYLINAVLCASPSRYDQSKTVRIGNRPLKGLTQLPLFLPVRECITRVTISGSRYPNRDYTCAETE